MMNEISVGVGVVGVGLGAVGTGVGTGMGFAVRLSLVPHAATMRTGIPTSQGCFMVSARFSIDVSISIAWRLLSISL